jgi:hypothetical protein
MWYPPSKCRFFVNAIEDSEVSGLDGEGLLGILERDQSL